jgi:AraC-like DNA-binding protein
MMEDNTMPDMLDEQGIPAREAGRLRSLFDANLCPMEYNLGRDKSLLSVTRFARVNLRGIDVIRDEGLGRRTAIRKPSHIRTQHSDDFLICLPHRAEVTLAQSGRQACVAPGSFSLLSTARPFSALITAANPQALFSHTIVRVPGPRLRSRVASIDACCSTPLTIRPGVGRIMTSLFDLAQAEGGLLSDDEARHFGDALLDTIADAALAAPELSSAQRPAPPSSHQRLREQAGHFILAHLSDPDLCADDVAQHCAVSVRYLRATFSSAQTSFGAFVRETRLQECRSALLNPELADGSVMNIAMSWGFNDAAWFSRAYRRQFGTSPSEDRRCALRSLQDKP